MRHRLQGICSRDHEQNTVYVLLLVSVFLCCCEETDSGHDNISCLNPSDAVDVLIIHTDCNHPVETKPFIFYRGFNNNLTSWFQDYVEYP